MVGIIKQQERGPGSTIRRTFSRVFLRCAQNSMKNLVCLAMSVESTMATISLRASRYSSSSNDSKMLHPGSCMMRKAVAKWWFSSTDVSL